MTRIFNIIASLCAKITRSCQDETIFVRYSCISARAKRSIRQKISDRLGFLFDGQGQEEQPCRGEHDVCIRQIDTEYLEDTQAGLIEGYIEELSRSGEYVGMICLVQILDEGLSGLLKAKIREFQEDNFSVVLNTNRETTGIGILPRTSCVWERKHRLSHSYNRLDNFLYHILLLENIILGDLIDKHYFLKGDWFPRFADSRSIKIAASPVRLERGFEITTYERGMVQYCGITYGNRSFEEDNAHIWEKILVAAGENADIVVFPEMLGNPQMAEEISHRLNQLGDEERKKIPSVILLPSVWRNQANTVTILHNNGEVLCQQTKQNPFLMEKDGAVYLEDIRRNMVVNILHYEGLGRMAVLVCKDFLDTRYLEQLMRCFKLTLILVPSYSTGSYDFLQSLDLCAHDDCNVVWINTCTALEKGKESNFKNIGYVRKRIGRNDDDSQKLCEMPICKGAFEGKCTHDCMFFETIHGM